MTEVISKFIYWIKIQKNINKMLIAFVFLFALCCLCNLCTFSVSISTSSNQSVALSPTTERVLLYSTDVPVISTPSDILLSCKDGGNNNYFCLVNNMKRYDYRNLELVLFNFCQAHDINGYCDINVWDKMEGVPESYPMTDFQMESRIAQYRKNESTGYVCFTAYDNGNQVYASSKCSK